MKIQVNACRLENTAMLRQVGHNPLAQGQGQSQDLENQGQGYL